MRALKFSEISRYSLFFAFVVFIAGTISGCGSGETSNSDTDALAESEQSPVVVTTLAVDPPAVGDVAPSIELESNEGNQVSLSDYSGQWAIVYFYPRDFTRGCTIEAQKFQQDLSKYEERDAVILGISVDTAESHKEFCEKESLEFKLLADIGGVVSKSYGSLSESGESAMSKRNTFLIAPDGRVAKVFLQVNVNQHSEEVLASIDELLSD